MKSTFNYPDDHIILTGADGNPRQVPRRAVRGFEALKDVSNDNQGCRSRVYVRSAENGATYKWNVRETCTEILYQMDGGPSRALVNSWQEGIIEDRRNDLENRLQNQLEQHRERLSEMARSAADDEATYGANITKPKLELQQSLSALDNSPRLRRVVRMMDWVQKQPEGSLREKAGSMVCGLFAGRDAQMLSLIPQKQKQLDRMEEGNKMRREAAERNRHEEEATFKREKQHLENQRGDTQMRYHDYQLLEKKIRDYKVGHQVPDFRFERDPSAPLDRYLPENELSHGVETRVQRQARMEAQIAARAGNMDIYDKAIQRNLDTRDPQPEIEREQIRQRALQSQERSRGYDRGR